MTATGPSAGGGDPHPKAMLEALMEPAAYPDDPSARHGIEQIQTHISQLYLTRDRVYKLRKAVALPFLSFESRDQRNADCLREVALNRRLAPDVYIGVAPIIEDASGRWQVGSTDEALLGTVASADRVEHCVVMRRLSEKRNAVGLLRSGVLGPAHVDGVAELLAKFHAAHGLGVPAPIDPADWRRRILRHSSDTFALARSLGPSALDPAALDECEQAMRELFDAGAGIFDRRCAAGRIVDGHGDLRLDHVFFEGGPAEPIAIDCIEFSEDLRHLDVADEIAFMAMDLVYRNRADLAERFLRRYAAESDDFELYGPIDYYILHRAVIRAAVAGVATQEPELGASRQRAARKSAEAHLRMALEHARRPLRPMLVLTCGMVGTGKSTVAEAVADAASGVVISSDRTRKHLAGIAPLQRATAAVGEGIYTDERTRAVYAALLERAAPVLASGRLAVLDATYSRAEQREAVRHWAAERGHRVLLIDVRCDEAVTLERLEARRRDATRVSDAGPELLAQSARRFEPPVEWRDEERVVVDTASRDWRDTLGRRLQRALRPRCRSTSELLGE